MAKQTAGHDEEIAEGMGKARSGGGDLIRVKKAVCGRRVKK